MTERTIDQRTMREVIELALAPYTDRVSASQLDAMRRALAEVLGSHPYSRALLRIAGPGPEVQQSGTVVVDDTEDSTSAALSTRGRRAGR